MSENTDMNRKDKITWLKRILSIVKMIKLKIFIEEFLDGQECKSSALLKRHMNEVQNLSTFVKCKKMLEAMIM